MHKKEMRYNQLLALGAVTILSLPTRATPCFIRPLPARCSPQLVLTQHWSWKQRSAKFSQCPEEALVEHSSQGSKLKGHLNIASRQIFEADLNVKALVGSFNVTIKPSRTFVSCSTQHPSPSPAQHSPTANCCAVTVVEDQMIKSVSDLKNLSAHFQGNIRNGEKWGEARKNSNKEP